MVVIYSRRGRGRRQEMGALLSGTGKWDRDGGEAVVLIEWSELQ